MNKGIIIFLYASILNWGHVQQGQSILTCTVTPVFQYFLPEHEVDIEALPLPDVSQIKVLIPAIGPQAKFKKALNDWKLTIHNTELNNIIITYGDNIGGLTPTRSSPILSKTSSPSTSAYSSSTDDRKVSIIIYVRLKCLD